MICPKCGNLISYNSYFGAYYCSMCGEYFQEVKKTNADKIRAMTDEELAEFLRWDICSKVRGDNRKCYGDCLDCVMKWLQQPSED